MGKVTSIEWTNRVLDDGSIVEGKTFNPWMGCTKVSEACRNCYAERDMGRRGVVSWGPASVGGTRVVTTTDYWRNPKKWSEQSVTRGVRPLVFAASLADIGEEWDAPIINNRGMIALRNGEFAPFQESPQGLRSDWQEVVRDRRLDYKRMDDFREDFFRLMARTVPGLDWLILTKRPELMLKRLRSLLGVYCDELERELAATNPNDIKHDKLVQALRMYRNSQMPANVWFGVTIESQQHIDRLAALVEMPSPRHFVSVEPQLGEVRFPDGWAAGTLDNPDVPARRNRKTVDWVIAGGESGVNSRVSELGWYRSLRDQCLMSGAKFFFKQHGDWGACSQLDLPPEEVQASRLSLPVIQSGGEEFVQIGKKKAGRLLDGVQWNQIPTSAVS